MDLELNRRGGCPALYVIVVKETDIALPVFADHAVVVCFQILDLVTC